jgi:hypothetical protein
MTGMKRVVAVALLALATAGCSVPGQQIAPGVAFTYDGQAVTNAEIDAIYQAWVYDTQGKDAPNRRQVLTIEAVREEAIAAAQPLIEDGTITLNDAEAVRVAEAWLGFLGINDTEPSPEMAHAAQGVFALALVAYTDPDGSVIQGIGDRVEAKLQGSPRAGTFDADVFVQSVIDAMTAAQNQDLQQFAFTALQNVNGFVDPATQIRQKPPAPPQASAPPA